MRGCRWRLALVAIGAVGSAGFLFSERAGPLPLGAEVRPAVEAPGHDTLRVAVEGTVRGNAGTGLRPLPGAVVELRTRSGSRTALADSGGRYRVGGVGSGDASLRVHSIGYAPAEVEVTLPSRGTLLLDVELDVRPIALSPLHVEGRLPVQAELGPLRPPGPAGLAGALALRTRSVSSGVVESGLAQALRELSRAGDEEPTSALLVRGGSTEGRLVLLDGSPVYAPFHVGGLVSSFDHDLLGGADFHVGGAPSRYDGGLSHILDLRTRAPRGDRIRSSGAVDGLGVRGVLEGGLLPGTRVLLGGRAVHGLQPRVVDGAPSPYGYGDFLLRADTELGIGRRLTTTAFRNDESVRLDGLGEVAPAWAGGNPPPSTARWGSRAVMSRYQGLWGGTGVEVGGAFSAYDARLPFRLSDPYLASARQERVRGSADFGRAWQEGTIRYGASVESQSVEYRVAPLEAGGGERPLTGQVRGVLAGGYVEASRALGAEVQARAGLRADHFSAEGGVRLAPRLSLTWHLSESAALTLAGGRFHQYQTTTGIGSEAELVQRSQLSREWVPELFVASANHLVVSLDQEVQPGTRLEVDGFLKRFEAPAPSGSDGTIHTSGLELRAHREGERLDVWAGYGLTWVWSQRGLEPASEFVGRQLLSAGFEGRLVGRTHLGLTVQYGAGLPVTSIPLATAESAGATPLTGGVVEDQTTALGRFVGTQAEGAPLLAAGLPGDFLRVDLEMDWRTTVDLRGRATELRPYLRVLNALNRRDALFHLFDPWRDDQVRPLAERPLLPVLGLEWRF